MPDYEVDSPEFKAWVRSSGGGGGGTRGGSSAGGGGGFPGMGSTSVLGGPMSGGGLADAMRRRRLQGSLTGAPLSTVPTSTAFSMPSRGDLSTVPTMSVYGTAAGGGSSVRSPRPMPAMPAGGGGGAPPSFGGRGRRGFGGNPGGGSAGGGGGAGGGSASVEWNPEALVKWLMSNAEKSGAFDVNGNPMLARMARENIMGDAGAREAAARTQAIMRSGGDPSMAGFASLMSGLNTAGQASGAASDAALKSAYDNQAFMRDLVARFAGPKQEQQGGSGWADALGPIAGALLGAVL